MYTLYAIDTVLSTRFGRLSLCRHHACCIRTHASTTMILIWIYNCVDLNDLFLREKIFGCHQRLYAVLLTAAPSDWRFVYRSCTSYLCPTIRNGSTFETSNFKSSDALELYFSFSSCYKFESWTTECWKPNDLKIVRVREVLLCEPHGQHLNADARF